MRLFSGISTVVVLSLLSITPSFANDWAVRSLEASMDLSVERMGQETSAELASKIQDALKGLNQPSNLLQVGIRADHVDLSIPKNLRNDVRLIHVESTYQRNYDEPEQCISALSGVRSKIKGIGMVLLERVRASWTSALQFSCYSEAILLQSGADALFVR